MRSPPNTPRNPSEDSPYVLGNDAEQATYRFAALEGCYDGVSRQRLAETGLGSGWRCWEVGAGGGALAGWLSDQVAATGQVVATDVAPSHLGWLRERANVQVMTHDVVREDPPEKDFDLIHARLVLLHLPQREAVVPRLAAALAPGGWLVVEEFDCAWTPVMSAPSREASALFERIQAAFLRVLRQAGADPLWGRKIYSALLRSGLEEVSSTTFAQAWHGGGSGVELHRANTRQLHSELAATGIRNEELRDYWNLLDDPNFAVNSYPMISARGRRPRTPP
ncbi:methyltransferase domain-containing protein [Saccharopolyspora taberi]|uniref:Methyltransferase domain-containing protein n=2 Tax=Saccharopolyspora taberi TaxID=60895 RepID=A0ABN3VHD5_9PSEU